MTPPHRRYVIHRPIAAGGAATVHLGRLLAPGGFARRVAIKRLHPALAQEPEVAASFADEARIASRLAHANIVAVLDVVAAEGELLLVMEYVHGETFSRLLMHARATRTPTAVPIVASVVTDMLHGLHAVHEATGEDGASLRIVHRDVSPQNVLVGTDGAARVVDFGIAKVLASSHVTRDGQIKGKLPYMAPEQLLRRSIDRRVDLYSAGVILWEALANKRLFVADDEPSLFSKVLEEPVVSPSAHNPAVPAALDAIALRAVSRDPEKRFPTAREMAVAIESAIARAPLSVVGDWVTHTASETLAKRAAMIGDMEREPSDALPSAPHEVRAPSASVIFRDEEPSSVDSRAVMPLAATVPSERSEPRRRRWRVAAAAGVAIVLLGSVALWRGTRPPAAAIEPEAPPVAASPVDSAPSAMDNAPPVAPATANMPSSVAPTAKVTTAPRAAAGAPTRWCKVFDADKKIYVMKPMRVARCP